MGVAKLLTIGLGTSLESGTLVMQVHMEAPSVLLQVGNLEGKSTTHECWTVQEMLIDPLCLFCAPSASAERSLLATPQRSYYWSIMADSLI